MRARQTSPRTSSPGGTLEGVICDGGERPAYFQQKERAKYDAWAVALEEVVR